jgi:hypothetical protein
MRVWERATVRFKSNEAIGACFSSLGENTLLAAMS